GVAVLAAGVVSGDRQRRLRERQLPGLVGEVVVARGGAIAVDRIGAGDGAGRGGGRVAAGSVGQRRLVLTVFEAADVMREVRFGVAVLAAGVVGGDRQRRFRQRELAVDVAELVVAGGAVGAVNRVRAGNGARGGGGGV